MRRAYDAEFIVEEKMVRNHRQRHKKKFVLGISLGADFTSEHEWGIRPLKEYFGIDSDKMGFERLVATKFPMPYIREFKHKKRDALLLLVSHNQYQREFFETMSTQDILNSCELNPFGDTKLVTAWDEGSFGILALDEEVDNLKEILKLWEDKDMCIGLGGRKSVFANSGLCISRASSFSEEIKEKMMAEALDYKRLQEEADKTGIKERLQKAGCRYFALSPRWINEHFTSKYPVIFWLNPMEQRVNNYGYFTVEQLDQWAKGEGPIIMKNK